MSRSVSFVADAVIGAMTTVAVAAVGAPTWAWVATGLLTFQVWRAASWAKRYG